MQYGFCKVRRGPDSDMYAHPAFARGRPETLSQLRKCISSATKKSSAPRDAVIAKAPQTHNSPSSVALSDTFGFARKISSVPARMTDNECPHIAPYHTSRLSVRMPSILVHNHWRHSPHEITTAPTPVPRGGYDSGRLDLLALALKSMAERDSSVSGRNATAIETA